MKKARIVFACISLLSLLPVLSVRSQLTGTKSIPGDYATIAQAVTALNSQGVGSGGVTFQVAAGHTETLTAVISLTATGTQSNPIVFRKNGVGNNPVITAFPAGTNTPNSNLQDGIWRLVGSDYVTIDGINLSENPLNITNPATMDYGFALYKVDGTNGCQHDTIRNCVITLSRVNNTSGSLGNGSHGILIRNSTPTTSNTAITVTQASGSNSYNAITGNTIQQCNSGISLLGFNDVSPYTFADRDNDIGGNSPVLGNIFLNFGGGGTNSCLGVHTQNQQNLLISYNTLNSNNGGGADHGGIIKGIMANTAPGASTTLTYNTVTLKHTGNSSAAIGVENHSGTSGSGNTVIMNHNTVTNCAYSGTANSGFFGVFNAGAPASLFMENNIVSNYTYTSASGTIYPVYNNGAVTDTMSLSGNIIDSMLLTVANNVTFRALQVSASGPASRVNISNNSVRSITHQVTSTGVLSMIYMSSPCRRQYIKGNIFEDLSLNTTATSHLIYANNRLSMNGRREVCNNSTVGSCSKTGTGGVFYGYYSYDYSNSSSLEIDTNNHFSNMSVTGNTGLYVWYSLDGTDTIPYGPKKIITGNVFTNISGGNGTVLVLSSGWTSDTAASQIYNNTVENITSGGGVIQGLRFEGAGSADIFENDIHGLSAATGTYAWGIAFGSGGADSRIYNNKIYDLQSNAANGSAVGINFAGAYTNLSVYHNRIADLRAPSATGSGTTGLALVGSSANTQVYYNTVHMNAVSSGTDFGSSALAVNASISNLDLRNNILINNSTPAGTGKTVAFLQDTAGLGNYLNTSNNNLFYAGTPSASNLIHDDSTNFHQTLNSFQTFAGPTRDSLSVTENTAFLSLSGNSPDFLRIDPYTQSFASNGGQNIAGFANDFEGDIRAGNIGYTGWGNTPDIGADEYTASCFAANPATITPLNTALCNGDSLVLTGTGATYDNDISYQWKISTVSGGPYTNVSGGSGNNDTVYQTAPLTVAGTYYYVLETMCSNGQLTGVSNEDTVIVNPVPTAAVQVNDASPCAGDTVQLSGSTNVGLYSWAGPNGFNSTQLNPSVPNIGLTQNGTYTFTAIVSGCDTAIASVNVTATALPVISLGNDTAYCQGNSFSVLLDAGNSGSTYVWNNGATTQTISVSTPDTFIVEVTDPNTCMGYDTIVVTENPSPVVNLGADINTVNPPVVLDAGNPGGSYLWNNGQTTQTLNVSNSDVYFVEVTNSFGCTGSDTIMVVFTLSSETPEGEKVTLSLYPNPATDIANISIEGLQSEKLRIEMTDMNGKIVLESQVENPAQSFIYPVEISGLPAGIYLFRLHADTTTYILRMVKS